MNNKYYEQIRQACINSLDFVENISTMPTSKKSGIHFGLKGRVSMFSPDFIGTLFFNEGSMKRTIVNEGDRYGRLRILQEVKGFRDRRFSVVCDCGVIKSVALKNLKNGKIKSCGCFGREAILKAPFRHGENRRGKKSREYETWGSMIARCHNEKDKAYRYYGGRGITVCDSWREFKNFRNDMGKRPDGMSLDRIDFNGNYEPSNCRWADRITQANNRRNVKFYTYKGKTLSTGQWSRELGLTWDCLKNRLSKYPPEIAFTMKRFSKKPKLGTI